MVRAGKIFGALAVENAGNADFNRLLVAPEVRNSSHGRYHKFKKKTFLITRQILGRNFSHGRYHKI